jgi:2-octaprenyl-6-methoxyphenol hydroxylase
MDFDVVVLGGGLIGASLLCTLREQDLKIALIDIAPLCSDRENSLDARALALSLTSVECLNRIGIWPKMVGNAAPILKIHVSKKGYFGRCILEAKDHNLPGFGYVVNADLLNHTINGTIQNTDNIRIFRPAEVQTLKKENKLWHIQLDSGVRMSAKLIVAADGATSRFRAQQGIGVQVSDNGQAAIVVNVQLERSHHDIAFERFMEEGSIAMLPFGDKQVKAIWIAPMQLLAQLKLLEEAAFLSKLQEGFGYRLGNLVHLGRRIIYPLRTLYSEAIYGDQWVLIGNAANTVYPIAAQGFNLGLRDVAFLAEKLVVARKNKQDIRTISLLQHYAELRAADHQYIRQGTDRLLDAHLLQWLGILACQWIAPFKRRVITWGLGKQDYLPKLCRGINL